MLQYRSKDMDLFAWRRPSSSEHPPEVPVTQRTSVIFRTCR